MCGATLLIGGCSDSGPTNESGSGGVGGQGGTAGQGGSGGDGAQAGSGGTTGGAGGAPPDDLDEILAQNNIVKMVEVDGIEFAETTADADGNVKFYSPNTNSVLANNAKDTLGAALPGTKIQAWSDGDVVTFHVVDPAGDIAPMLYSTAVPEPGANTVELTVDGEQLYYNGEDPTDISPLDTDPYAFTIAGLSVSISIQSVAQSMLWTAAMSVLGHVVKGTCGFFNPLHQSECASLAKWVTKLAGFARPSFITKFLAAPVWETISVVGNEIATPLSNWICADVIGARLVGYLDPTDESAEAQAREVEVRKRIYEINYLVKKLEDAPPPNLSAVEARLDNSLGLAMSLRQLARKGNIIAEGTESDFWSKSAMAQLKTAVKSVTGAKVGLHDTTGTSLGDRWFLGLLKSVDPPVDYKALEGRKSVDTWAGLSRGGKIAASSALNCAFALVDKVALHDYSGGTEAEITTARAIDLATEALRKDLADIYALAGYGVPAPPDCLPDLVSAPSWQAAVSSPSTGDPSSGIVRVYDATMCSDTEEDWYAFATGAINFQIQARIMRPESPPAGGEHGLDKVLCVEPYWYTSVNELAMTPPASLPGATCGTVQSQPSTSQINVAGTIGETFRYVLFKVYPQSGQTDLDHVTYELLANP